MVSSLSGAIGVARIVCRARMIWPTGAHIEPVPLILGSGLSVSSGRPAVSGGTPPDPLASRGTALDPMIWLEGQAGSEAGRRDAGVPRQGLRQRLKTTAAEEATRVAA